MVKHLDQKISSLSFDKEDHPGCLWGVIHVLRSYQWNNVKKMMPNKKSAGSRRQAASIRYSKLRSNNPDTSKAQVSIDVNEDDMNMREMLSSPSHSRSRKSRGSMPSLSSFRAHFVRTDSIHHLDPSSHMLPDEIRECGPYGCKWNPRPQETSETRSSCCDETCLSASSMKDMSPSQLDELGRQLIDNAILQNKLERSRESLSRKKLLVANKSRRDITVCQPKDVLDTLETINLNSGKSQKHLLNSSYSLGHNLNTIHASSSKRGLTKSDSFPIDVASNRNSLTPRKLHKLQKEDGYFDDSVVDVLKQNQESTSFPSVRLELKKRSFKNIRRKIKNAIKESKKERHRICMDAIFHKVPYGSRFTKDFKRGVSSKLKKSVFYRSEKKRLRNNCDTNNLTAIVSNSGISSIRRTKSLNESLDRYSQLLELTTDREPKQLQSPRLKLVNVSGASSLVTSPNPIGRVMSLPILDIYQCTDALFSGIPTINTQGSEQESKQDINGNVKQAHPSPISVLDSCFEEDISTPTKISILEGIESELGKVLVDEVNREKLKLSNRNLTPDLENIHVDRKNEAGFNYVKDILKLSGLTGQGSLGTWYSPEQPVNPSLFEEVETSSPLKSDHSGDDDNTSCDHQLLFDMINEVLLEIHEKSFTYWPLALSSNCHIRPRPSGSYVLEEVWRIISWYLNSQPEFEPLDYLVVRDLSKNDGWMNLQLDSERVGLELEQMIMDDLLDEMVYE